MAGDPRNLRLHVEIGALLVDEEATVPFIAPNDASLAGRVGAEDYDSLVNRAESLEDAGRLSEAADVYRSLLMRCSKKISPDWHHHSDSNPQAVHLFLVLATSQ